METTTINKYDLDTPCLTIDIGILEQNIQTMQATIRAAGKNIRPHAKTHKCSILAKKQIQAGAIGICTAKVSEAETLVDAGIREVLVTGPVVTARKIERLVAILKMDPMVMVVVDHADNARMLDEALARLSRREPEAAELVKLRIFAGLSLEEAAAAVGVSRATAYRQWTYARAWLLAEMEDDG